MALEIKAARIKSPICITSPYLSFNYGFDFTTSLRNISLQSKIRASVSVNKIHISILYLIKYFS